MKLANKKVLFVITKSNWGGAQSYVYTLATRLKDTGADVAVVLGGTGEAGSESGLLAERLQEAGIRTLFLKSFMRDISLIREFKALRELIYILKSERPDVVHLNSSKAGGLGAVAARLTGVPRIVFTAHGWPFWEPRNFVAQKLIYFFSWITVMFSHAVITISDYDL
ncbi:MAG: glycosyltransferase, partial [Minisyncoccia bacterium]